VRGLSALGKCKGERFEIVEGQSPITEDSYWIKGTRIIGSWTSGEMLQEQEEFEN
jgi:hypothetical protein